MRAEAPVQGKQRVWFTGNRLAVPNGATKDLKRPTPVAWFEEQRLRWSIVTFGPDYGVAVTEKKGSVYLWGYDSVKRKFVAPLEVDFTFGEIADVATTDDAVFVLTKAGRVYMLHVTGALNGEKVFRHVVLPPSDAPSMWNMWLPGAARVVSISAGRRHVSFADARGHVYTMGCNLYGQCGRKLPPRKLDEHGTTLPVSYDEETPVDWSSQSPYRVACPMPALSVACGGRHTMITTSDGVYAFGDDSNIQLGLGDTRYHQEDYQPWLSGLTHRSHLTADGNAPPKPYDPIVKFNFYGAHSLPKPTRTKEASYGSIKSFGSALKVACGENFSVFVHSDPQPDWFKTKASVLLACGDNLRGQCGRNKSKQHQTTLPVRLPKNAEVDMVRCGQGHCLALVDGSKVYGWGLNDQGQVGTGNFVDSCPPVVVMGSKLRGPVDDVLVESNNSLGTGTARKSRLFKPDGTLYDPEELKTLVTPADEQGVQSQQVLSQDEQASWKVSFVEARYKNSVIIADRYYLFGSHTEFSSSESPGNPIIMVLDVDDVAAMEMMVSQQDKELRTLEGRRSACEDVTEIAESLRDFKRRRGISNDSWVTFLQDQFKQNLDKIRKFTERPFLSSSPPTTASAHASIHIPEYEEVLSPLTGDFECPSTPPAPAVNSNSPTIREQQLLEREKWLDKKMAEVEEELRKEQSKLDRLLVSQSIPSFSELITIEPPRQLVQARAQDTSFVSADSEEATLQPYRHCSRRMNRIVNPNDKLSAAVSNLVVQWSKWRGI